MKIMEPNEIQIQIQIQNEFEFEFENYSIDSRIKFKRGQWCYV